MNKELCFILDNKNIYLDHILVDYEYVPIFFLCKDDECQYYLALCTDIENGEYIVVKISLLNVYNLLHGNIAMRDVILNQKIFWKVVSGDEIKNDIVNEYPIDYINHQDLPEKDAKFKILQKHIKEYVQKFDKEFFASEQYDKEKSIKLNLGYYGIDGVPYDLCPNCKTNLCTTEMRARKKMKYCQECCQKLDWSENDE